jgi:hypothetical protein
MSRRGISGAGSAEPTQHEPKGYLRSVFSFPHVAHCLLAFCILQRDLGRLVASLQPQPAENLSGGQKIHPIANPMKKKSPTVSGGRGKISSDCKSDEKKVTHGEWWTWKNFTVHQYLTWMLKSSSNRHQRKKKDFKQRRDYSVSSPKGC